MGIKRSNEEICKSSGTVQSSDPLVSFLYLLIRDELSAGKVEAMITEIVNQSFPATFTNGWLAQYAINLADSLKSVDNVEKESLRQAGWKIN